MRSGRVKRKRIARSAAGAEPRDAAAPSAETICPLCERPIPSGARSSLHHLTPKLRGGKRGPTVRLHQICHNEIHASLIETELARDYAEIEALRAHPRLARFIAWVRTKPPGYHGRSLASLRRRKR